MEVTYFPLDPRQHTTKKNWDFEEKTLSIFTSLFPCDRPVGYCQPKSRTISQDPAHSFMGASTLNPTKTAPDHHPFHRQGLVMCWVNPGFRYHHLPDTSKKTWKSQIVQYLSCDVWPSYLSCGLWLSWRWHNLNFPMWCPNLGHLKVGICDSWSPCNSSIILVCFLKGQVGPTMYNSKLS